MENKLPEGWEWKKLGEISIIKAGGTPSRGEMEYWKDGTIPWVKISDMKEKYVSGTSEFITEAGLKNSSAKIIPKGTILISIFASLGQVGILDIDATCNQAIAGVQICDKSVDKIYLYYYLISKKDYFLNIGRGVAQNNINQKILKETEILVPPLETQHKIVAILEKAEETKKLRAQADELTQKLLQSVFLEMFGDPVKNPKNCEKKALKEFGEIITGNTPSREKPEYYGDYIEWIKSDNINTPYTYLTRSEEMLSEKGVKVGRTASINSILVTCIAGSLSCIGNVAITDRNVAFNQQINAIVPNEHVNSLFLYHLILNTKEYIQSHSTQSMKGMISKGVFGSIQFIMPPIEVQVKFAEFAKRVEKMITSQNQSSLEINNLFDVLMQKAFAGELVS